MRTNRESRLDRLRDERGVALPLALFGLVAVSILVTTALLTSSTEFALSSAHQEGTRGLYRADDVLERYIAERAALTWDASAPRLVPGSYAYDTDAGTYRVAVAEMAHGPVIDNPDGSVSREDIYSFVTSPADGRGRGVGALLKVGRELPPFVLDVDAGITVGGDLTIGGSSAVSDGRNAAGCDSALSAQNAVQVSDSAAVTINGSGVAIDGAVDTATYSKAQMVEALLGGRTLDEAAKHATVKFAAGTFPTLTKVLSYDGSGPRPRDDRMNWGCPATLLPDCTTYGGDNVSYLPTVAIDAGGDRVKITGDHGQGILLVYNGSLSIEGNFVYSGVILVEQDLNIRGTGGSTAKIEGAVLALGESSTIDDNVTGNAVITFSRCSVDAAVAAFQAGGINTAEQKLTSGTSSWFEVVR